MARYGTSRCAELVLWTVVGALLAAGCGGVAWQQATYGTRQALARPPGATLGAPLEAIWGARGDPRAAVEEPVPKLEIFTGIMPMIAVGEKVAGHDGKVPPGAVHWDEAFEGTFGFEVQVNLRRPPRSAIDLAAGDTFLGVRLSLEWYTGLESPNAPGAPAVGWPAGGGGQYDDMTLIGVWLDGRTLLNPLGVSGLARTARPYLHYGGGLVSYPEVLIVDPASGANYANWGSTWALGWHMGVGIEIRTGRLGVYAEGGIQTVGPPDVADDPYLQPWDVDQRTAHNLVTYPFRVGVMVAF